MKIRWIIFLVFLLVLFFVGSIKFTGFSMTNASTCSDTDNGKNYYVKGDVRGDFYFLSKEFYSEADYCLDEERLVEYYCVQDGNEVNSYRSSLEYKCKKWCVEGKCTEDAEVRLEGTEVCEGVLWCRIKGWLFE